MAFQRQRFTCDCGRTTYYSVAGSQIPDDLAALLDFVGRTMDGQQVRDLLVRLKLESFEQVEGAIVRDFGQQRADDIRAEIEIGREAT